MNGFGGARAPAGDTLRLPIGLLMLGFVVAVQLAGAIGLG
jgi:hypothetical protein